MRTFFFATVMMLSIVSSEANASTFSFGDSLPAGNYQHTCNACYRIGKELVCTCETNAGLWITTSARIPHRCDYVQNTNGQLACADYRHHHHRHHWGHHHRRHYRDITAGPIWDNNDANQVCPSVCANHRSRWTGQWNTISWGAQSVCQCERH